MAETFAHILAEAGRLDVLVNSVWDGYERMVEAKRGFIVRWSHWAAQKYLGNAIYGISKAATDRMAPEIAHELADHGVAALSNDTKAMRHSGKVLAAAQLGKDYGFKDIDGKSPTPLTVADV